MEYFLSLLDLTIITLLVVMLKYAWNWLIGLQKVDEIDKKYVFVTGCDSGFGEELCIELDRLGCHVFAGCLTVDGMVNIKNRCSNNVFPVILDVCDHASVLKCLEYIKSNLPEGKGLWGLVNNAGICGTIGPTQWLNVNDFKEVIRVNLLGAIDVTLSTLPLLRSENKHESVRIVNMTSVLAHFHSPVALPYSLSKSSLDIFSKVLRMEFLNSNFKISTIQPGAHISNFTDRTVMSLKQSWDRLPPVEQIVFGKHNYEKLLKFGKNYLSVFGKKSKRNVINAYLHALFSKKPQNNYLIGLDAIVLKVASCCLPQSVLAFLYHMSTRVTKSEPDKDTKETVSDDK